MTQLGTILLAILTLGVPYTVLVYMAYKKDKKKRKTTRTYG